MCGGRSKQIISLNFAGFERLILIHTRSIEKDSVPYWKSTEIITSRENPYELGMFYIAYCPQTPVLRRTVISDVLQRAARKRKWTEDVVNIENFNAEKYERKEQRTQQYLYQN